MGVPKSYFWTVFWEDHGYMSCPSEIESSPRVGCWAIQLRLNGPSWRRAIVFRLGPVVGAYRIVTSESFDTGMEGDTCADYESGGQATGLFIQPQLIIPNGLLTLPSILWHIIHTACDSRLIIGRNTSVCNVNCWRLSLADARAFISLSNTPVSSKLFFFPSSRYPISSLDNGEEKGDESLGSISSVKSTAGFVTLVVLLSQIE